MDEAKLLSNQLGLSVSSTTWWTKDDDSGWSSWSVAFESQGEHLLQLSGDIGLSLVLGIMLEDELVEGLPNTFHVELVLLEARLS